MSEKFPIHNENLENKIEDIKPKAEIHVEKHETEAPKHEHREQIDKIIDKIEHSAKSSAELHKIQEDTKTKSDEHKKIAIGGQLKSQARRQSLKRIQRRLPAYQKPVSKFMHNNSVEGVNKVVGSTIARPSGLFAAGLFSFSASIVTLIVCRYYGYEYNYFIGVASLGIGFVVGIAFELVTLPLKKKHN